MPNFRGSPRSISRVIALGTSNVTTATHLVGFAPCKGRVKEIRMGGQAAVTATTLTAEVKKLATDGSASTTLQSEALDIELVAANDDELLNASLTATVSNRDVLDGQMIEVVVTADTCTAGPGDLIVDVLIEPRG